MGKSMKKKIASLIILSCFCFYSDYSAVEQAQEEKKEFLEKLDFHGKKYVPADFSKIPKSMQRKIEF